MTQEGQEKAGVESKMDVTSSSPVKSAPAAQPESGSSPEKQDKLSKALNALVQGKRHFLMKDTTHAVSALGDACRLLTEIYGPIASEHAEAHFFYGKSLLDMARAELSIFEAPTAGEKSEEDDEDEEEEDGSGDEEDEEEDEDKEGEESGEKEEEKEVKTENGIKEEKPDGEATITEEDLNAPSPAAPGPSSSSAATANDGEKPGTSSGVTAASADGAEPEDLSNLELAWEVLEIAKLGFKNQIEGLEAKLKDEKLENREEEEKNLKQIRRRLAETHTVLGEVSTESENYPQAIEDFKTSLAMYSELESPDSREIAQIHFHIGVAHGLAKDFQESVASFNLSLENIRQRIENLKKTVKELAGDASDTKEQLEREIKELTELVPELEERINDTLEQEKEAFKVEAEEKMEEEIIQRNSPVKNPNPPAANDISHLVKKRKKVEEPASNNLAGNNGDSTEPPSKKACTNLNFETPMNGHSIKEED